MKWRLIIALLFTMPIIRAQQLSLDSCIIAAKRHYPQIAQYGLNQELSTQNIHAINEGWYPKLSLGLQGTYQTEVVSINFPGMTTNFPHDSYLASLGIEQTLFDGGTIRNQRKMEVINQQIEDQKTDIELYKLIDRVNQAYVSILMGHENLNIFNLYKEDLQNRRKNLEQGVLNGLVLESSLNELDAEILKAEQSIKETEQIINTSSKTLAYLTGLNISATTQLVVNPAGGVQILTEVNRAELQLINSQRELLKTRYSLALSTALPKISIGGSGNYGRPGPNFINQDLRFFASASLQLKWNVSTLYGLNREKNRYDILTRQLNMQEEVFKFNLQNSIISQNDQVTLMKQIIQTDQEIIDKRHAVTGSAASQMENGKITVANYLTQLNAELQAKLNMKIHEIKLMNAISTINITSGITLY